MSGGGGTRRPTTFGEAFAFLDDVDHVSVGTLHLPPFRVQRACVQRKRETVTPLLPACRPQVQSAERAQPAGALAGMEPVTLDRTFELMQHAATTNLILVRCRACSCGASLGRRLHGAGTALRRLCARCR